MITSVSLACASIVMLPLVVTILTAPSPVAMSSAAVALEAYVLISEAGICFVVVPSITTKASASAIVIDDVDFADPSRRFSSAAVEPTAVLPRVNCPSGTIKYQIISRCIPCYIC